MSLCFAIHALVARSPKWPPSLFGGLSRDSLSCCHGGASGFLLKVHGPCACEIAISDECAGRACFAYRAISLTDLCPPASTISSGLPPLWREKRLLETSSTLALKRMATRGGAYREEDGRRNRNKHIDKVKRDQDAALDRYVL